MAQIVNPTTHFIVPDLSPPMSLHTRAKIGKTEEDAKLVSQLLRLTAQFPESIAPTGRNIKAMGEVLD